MNKHITAIALSAAILTGCNAESTPTEEIKPLSKCEIAEVAATEHLELVRKLADECIVEMATHGTALCAWLFEEELNLKHKADMKAADIMMEGCDPSDDLLSVGKKAGKSLLVIMRAKVAFEKGERL